MPYLRSILEPAWDNLRTELGTKRAMQQFSNFPKDLPKDLPNHLQASLLKWRILLKILPYTLLFCTVKWAIHFRDWELWQFDLMTGSLFGAATFVIAFILSGTLSDYRASEEMVSQIASTVESIQDSSLFVAVNHPDYDPTPLTQGLVQVLETVLAWLEQDQSPAKVSDALSELSYLFAQLETHTSGPVISRVQAEQGKLRLMMARIQLIRDTDFLPPAYVMLQVFLAGAIVTLLLTNGEQMSKTLVVSGFLFTSFVYLVALIHDLDNPFQYDGRSCVDVDLAPLNDAIIRLQPDRSTLAHSNSDLGRT